MTPEQARGQFVDFIEKLCKYLCGGEKNASN